MIKVLSLGLILSASSSVLAMDVNSVEYNTVEDVEIYTIEEDPRTGKETQKLFHQGGMNDPIDLSSILKRQQDPGGIVPGIGFDPGPPGPLGQFGSVLAMTDSLLAFGQRVVGIIREGTPVFNEAGAAIKVLPRIAGLDSVQISGMDLENWRTPFNKKIKFIVRNWFGMKMVDVTYMLMYTYGGQLNGTGRYLTGVEVKPVAVDVQFGYELNVDFELQSIRNMGSSFSPVAAATIMINSTISTILSKKMRTMVFNVRGDGGHQQIN